jgi:polysaccharide biosynthesis protein PelF
MDITLITEGTYPYHMGGVSVWCDQLVRELPEYNYRLLALTATGGEKHACKLADNVTSMEAVPLWGPSSRRRASRALRRQFRPVLERFVQSLAIENAGKGYLESLQEFAEFAQAGQLTSAMSSKDAVDLLMAIDPVCSDRPSAAEPTTLSVGDAVDALTLLEHSLRPLAVSIPSADLCHGTANGLGTLPALAAKWDRGTPFLLTEHGVYLRELYLSYKPGTLSQPARAIVLRFFKLLIETAYEAADIVAPVCSYNSLWEVANAASPVRIRPVLNGIDPSSFPVALAEPEVPTLVFVGRIDPLKDIETLLRGFAQVRQAVPDARLKLFGPVPHGGEGYGQLCADLLSELGLEGIATFEGRISPPVEAYHAGHVVVLTSISEGLPYVVLEAMASGRPVIATNVGGVAEAVGDTGLLVPPRDPSAFADACIRLLTNTTERRAMASAARRRVLDLFTSERAFGIYRALYEELGTRQRSNVLRMPSRRGYDEEYQPLHLIPGVPA